MIIRSCTVHGDGLGFMPWQVIAARMPPAPPPVSLIVQSPPIRMKGERGRSL